MIRSKKDIRNEVLDTLKNLDESIRINNTYLIHKNLYNTNEWDKATHISITISMDFEIDTYDIIRNAWKEGKKVSVPLTNTSTKLLEFYELNNFSSLEKSKFGIMEPNSDCVKSSIQDFDLIIVPGVAFNTRKYRIGYGGGYYDRFLPNTNAVKISLANEFQITDEFIEEKYDYPVNKVITENEVFSI